MIYKIHPVSKEKSNVNKTECADVLISNNSISFNKDLDLEIVSIPFKLEKYNLSDLACFFSKHINLYYEKFTAEEYEKQDLFKLRNLQSYDNSTTIVIEYLKLYVQDALFSKVFNIENISFKRYGKRLKVESIEFSHNSTDFKNDIEKWRTRNVKKTNNTTNM